MSATTGFRPDQARDRRGQWVDEGNDIAGLEADITLDGDTTSEPEFEWNRIESLMGTTFHLDPERTVNPPKIKPDDDIAQITRKMMLYIKKTQDVDSLTDEQVSEMVGMPLHELNGQELDPATLRNLEATSENRVVVCSDERGHPVYISCNNTAKRTGNFYSRWSGRQFGMENLAQRGTAHTYLAKFHEQHPEFTDAEIDRLKYLLTNKKISGKDYKHVWSEARFRYDSYQFVATAYALKMLEDGKTVGSKEEFDEQISALTKEELDDLIDKYAVRSEYERYDGQVFNKLNVPGASISEDFLREEIDQTGELARRRLLNRTYRAFLEEELQLETDYGMQRKYIRDNNAEHSATVFEQKKNVPQSHLDAAEQSVFRTTGDFKHVEVDADTDLERLAHVENEYAELRKYLPQTDVTPTLRFRKTGRHKALGVYHPHAANLAVDPRSPKAAIHEYLHHVDHTAGDKNISSSDEFRPLLRKVQKAVSESNDPFVMKKLEYMRTPTEVLSRAGERYFAWKGVDTSLNGTNESYEEQAAYAMLEPFKDEIIAFFDKKLAELGAEVPQGR